MMAKRYVPDRCGHFRWPYGHVADLWVRLSACGFLLVSTVTITLKCTVMSYGHRQTDRETVRHTDGSQHCLIIIIIIVISAHCCGREYNNSGVVFGPRVRLTCAVEYGLVNVCNVDT